MLWFQFLSPRASAERFRHAFAYHVAFGVLAFIVGVVMHLHGEATAMRGFGRDVMLIVAFMVSSRVVAERVARHDLLRGWVIGSVSWTVTNVMGWTSFNYHLHHGEHRTISLDMSVLWVTVHVPFATTLVLWPTPPACMAVTHLTPFVAALLAPDYMPISMQRVTTCAALLLGLCMATTMDRSLSSAYAMSFELQKERDEQRRVRRDHMAEARLNHIIKGRCGGAVMLLDEMVQRMGRSTEEARVAEARELDRPIKLLRQAVEWCHSRQVFVQLEEGTYSSVRREYDVCEQIRRIVGNGDSSIADLCISCPANLHLDPGILAIAIEEAFSNSCKYREPGTHITLNARFLTGADISHTDGRWWAEAVVGGDEVDADSVNVGEETEMQPGWFIASLDNEDLRGAHRLTEAECDRVFEAGFKARNALATSDGLGLSSVALALRAAGGHARLRTYDADNGSSHTICELALPALLPATTTSSAAGVLIAAAPAASADDTAVHEGESLAGSICVGVDDDDFMRDILETSIFGAVFQANMARSRVLGATREEQDMALELALGLLDASSLQPLPLAEQRQADIVLFDENLLDGVSGSDLAGELQMRGYRNLSCVLTASSTAVIESIAIKPGVDLVLNKGCPLAEMKRQLHSALTQKRRAQAGQEARAHPPQLGEHAHDNGALRQRTRTNKGIEEE